MKLFGSISLICLLFVCGAAAQTPAPTPPAPDDGDIVKISTTLIQVDVSVVDKKGNQVIGLTPADFEIRENGKPQKITNLSYVAIGKEPEAAPEKPVDSRVPPVSVKLRPEQVRRTIVLLVDDLGLTVGSMFAVKETLKKFVNEQMQPDDLVAIMRTGSGVGALQQFTSDKRLLLAAISKIKWSFISRYGSSFFEPIRPTLKELISGMVDESGNESNVQGNDKDRANEFKIDDFREETYTVGTLGTIRQVVAGLNKLPGRKGIILFSDGLSVNMDIMDKLRRVVDEANRAGVVINTINAQGVTDAGFMGPENDNRTMSFEQIDAAEVKRKTSSFNAQGGLSFLAYETGGTPIKGANDLNWGIEKILKAEQGYYLLSYEPDDELFDASIRKYNRLEIKVNRPDTNVSYRSGFFSYTDGEVKKAKGSGQELGAALLSPFASKDIETRLTSIFANDVTTGKYTRALLHIDAKGLEFSDAADGNKSISLDIYAYVFGPDGEPAGYINKNYVFAVRASSMPRLLEKGIIYPMIVPIDKPGFYQLKMAVRDTKSGKIGSASQFVEIPDLKSKHLALSGIVLQNLSVAELKARMGGNAQDTGEAKILNDTSIRVFKRGTILIYNYEIYNAIAGQGAQLQTHIRLFRDGKLVYEGPKVPVKTAGQADLARVEDRGVMTIGSNLAPGDYVLQVVATDSLAKEKHQIAAQSIDFEVVE
jgi:VWFA-related protein